MGHQVTGNGVNGYRIQTEWGDTLGVRGPNAELALAHIRSVGIANLAEVKDHYINRIAACTSHVVRFHGGGTVRFSFNDHGELLELSADSVCMTSTPDGCLTFAAYRP
jgi:hypothetical protein